MGSSRLKVKRAPAPQNVLRAGRVEDATAYHATVSNLKAAVDAGSVEAATYGLAALDRWPEDPVLSAMTGMALLAQGDYGRGAPLFESRTLVEGYFQRAGWRIELPAPEWRGESLMGKHLLIMPEGGFGDQIMMARFARWLADNFGCVVTVAAPPELLELFASLRTLMRVRVIPFRLGEPLIIANPHYWTRWFSVLAWAKVTLKDLPAQPYLSPPAGKNGLPGARIGVSAQGNPNAPIDAHRSLPEALAERLARLPGAIRLEPEHTGATTFAETAEIIAGLDLVISVDSANAHLAGAMGKPVWILLPDHFTDWRWMRERTDSPWYSTARLYRQRPGGGWAEVIEQIERDVPGFLAASREPRSFMQRIARRLIRSPGDRKAAV